MNDNCEISTEYDALFDSDAVDKFEANRGINFLHLLHGEYKDMDFVLIDQNVSV